MKQIPSGEALIPNIENTQAYRNAVAAEDREFLDQWEFARHRLFNDEKKAARYARMLRINKWGMIGGLVLGVAITAGAIWWDLRPDGCMGWFDGKTLCFVEVTYER